MCLIPSVVVEERGKVTNSSLARFLIKVTSQQKVWEIKDGPATLLITSDPSSRNLLVHYCDLDRRHLYVTVLNTRLSSRSGVNLPNRKNMNHAAIGSATLIDDVAYHRGSYRMWVNDGRPAGPMLEYLYGTGSDMYTGEPQQNGSKRYCRMMLMTNQNRTEGGIGATF